MNDAWRTFVEHDRRLTAPPHLQPRVLQVIASRTPSRSGVEQRLILFAAAAAAMVVFMIGAAAFRRAPLTGIEARPLLISVLPPAVVPRLLGDADATESPFEVHPNRIVRHEELPAILVMFDFAPAFDTEPLQLVRLRVPREALQELGVPLLEPDATGMVDLDMLVGEDGLPRDIRRIRREQEDR